MNGHALLSPSGAKRWMACTPSAILESHEPYQAASVYAAEGTEAHELGELKLAFALEKISVEEYHTKFEHFRMTAKFYNEDFNAFVNDYVKEVMDIVTKDYEGLNVEVYLEDKVEFTHIVPKGSGTSDVVIVGPDFIHVIDLKFGKGVAVSAIGNPQLRLYALGALKKYQMKGVFTEARMTIIQPRLYDKTTDYLPVMELNNWAITEVKPKAEMASRGEGQLVAGDHCMWCKRKGKCEALGQQQLAVARQEFEQTIVDDKILDPVNMTPEMLSRVLTIAPKFIKWFNEVTSYTKLAMVNEDLKIPGYKVVEGRSTRIMSDQAGIAEKLRTSGFKEEDYLTAPKLLGITKLEKNVGKKLFTQLCDQFIIKPPGKPSVVLETDRRTALDIKDYKLTGQEFQDTDKI
jgi:hypothetical protein